MKLVPIVFDLLLLAGLACLLWGLWQIYPPAMWIVLGTLLSAAAMQLGRQSAKSQEPDSQEPEK